MSSSTKALDVRLMNDRCSLRPSISSIFLSFNSVSATSLRFVVVPMSSLAFSCNSICVAPYSIEELDAAVEEDKKVKEGVKGSKLEQILYRCPQCLLRAFGKAGLWVVCGECRCAMEEND